MLQYLFISGTYGVHGVGQMLHFKLRLNCCLFKVFISTTSLNCPLVKERFMLSAYLFMKAINRIKTSLLQCLPLLKITFIMENWLVLSAPSMGCSSLNFCLFFESCMRSLSSR